MSSYTKENEIAYDAWSSFYDSYANPTVAIDELTFPGVYKTIRNQNVLEIGCGTGRHTRRLIEAENLVTGIDISEGMLNRLRAKISSPNLTLVKGDFLSQVIPNAPFDSIVASLVLEHIPDLKSFFESARKVLKTNGQIYLSELHPKRTAAGTFAHFRKSDGVEVHLRSSAHQSDEIINAAASNGFEVAADSSVQGNAELAALNPKWEKFIDAPMIQIWIMKLID